jgi:hypothetical protein
MTFLSPLSTAHCSHLEESVEYISSRQSGKKSHSVPKEPLLGAMRGQSAAFIAGWAPQLKNYSGERWHAPINYTLVACIFTAPLAAFAAAVALCVCYYYFHFTFAGWPAAWRGWCGRHEQGAKRSEKAPRDFDAHHLWRHVGRLGPLTSHGVRAAESLCMEKGRVKRCALHNLR